MGVPSSSNIELANYIYFNYPNALLVDIENLYLSYPNWEANSATIDFAFVREIKCALLQHPTDMLILVAPFCSKFSREIIFEEFKGAEFVGIWVERSRQDILSINSSVLPSYQLSEDKIDYLLKYKVSPTQEEEPFTDIFYISREINTGMSRKYPIITDIETALTLI